MPMILQPRDIETLAHLAHYFILNSRQIRQLAFPDDSTGRIARRRLTKLMAAGYLRKRNMHVVNPADGSASPVFHLAKTGREFLAGHFDDDTYLMKPLEPSQPQHLYHYVAVSDTHRLFDTAIAKCEDPVLMPRWHNEDEVINPEEAEPAKRRHLRAEFSVAPRVVCLPDAGFLLEYKGHRLAVYLEQDRDTFFHDRVAARKSRGYQQLLISKRHREHFPETTFDIFYVLFVAPTRKRAEQLRRSFNKKNNGTDAAKVYRFASLDEITPDNLLFEPMLSCCHHDDRVPLIKRIE